MAPLRQLPLRQGSYENWYEGDGAEPRRARVGRDMGVRQRAHQALRTLRLLRERRGQARGSISIDGCKAYVKNMVQGDSGKEAYRGWIVGYIDDNAGKESPSVTITDCSIGGSSTSATAVTLDADNFDDDHNDHTYGYFYGSKGSNATVTFTGTQSYWEAIKPSKTLKTVDITIADYATSHSWESTNSYSIEQDDVTLTPSDNGAGSPNGVYNTQWRFYQARGGGLRCL